MSVYVDAENLKFRNMIMCHMIADSVDELHDMALKIGLKKEWFQANSSFPHYDISLSVKKKALELGAIEVSRRELVLKIKALKKL